MSSLEPVVATLREQALTLYADALCPPSLVRVSAGDVVVQVEWGTPAVAPVTGPPVLAAVTSVAVAQVRQADLPSTAEQAGEPGEATFPLCAESVGVFYRSPEPGKPAFVAIGDTIAAGRQVGIVEAMKLMIPVAADRPGRVVEFLAEDGASVEHGQPLLLLAAPE